MVVQEVVWTHYCLNDTSQTINQQTKNTRNIFGNVACDCPCCRELRLALSFGQKISQLCWFDNVLIKAPADNKNQPTTDQRITMWQQQRHRKTRLIVVNRRGNPFLQGQHAWAQCLWYQGRWPRPSMAELMTVLIFFARTWTAPLGRGVLVGVVAGGVGWELKKTVPALLLALCSER